MRIFRCVRRKQKQKCLEAGKKVPITGKQSDIIRAQCACFMCSSIPCLAREQGADPLRKEQHQAVCNEAAESLLDFETAEANALDSKYNKYAKPEYNAAVPASAASQMETVSREETTRNGMVRENIPIPEG